MGLLIDSCVFVRFERTQRAIPFTDFGTRDKTFVSAVTVSEMLVGMHMANTPERFARRKLVVESLVSHLGVLNFTVSTA